MDYNLHTRRMFNVGDIVIAKQNGLDKTHVNYTATDDMFKMSDRKHKMTVKVVTTSDRCAAGIVNAGGWNWHPADLFVVEHVKEDPLVVDGPEGIFQFNPETM